MTGLRHAPMPPSPVAVIAAGDRASAEQWAQTAGVAPVLVLDRLDAMRLGPRLPRHLREAGVASVVLHSRCWERQEHSRLFEVMLAACAGCRRWIADGTDPIPVERPLRALLADLVRGTLEPLQVARTVRREARLLDRWRPAGAVLPRAVDGGTVLAIWHGGSTGDVGGSVSHISGILGGFRSLGLRIHLASAVEPPAQVLAVVDDLEVAAALPPGLRVTYDVAQLTGNDALRAAAGRLARRSPPTFVYQRHGYGLVAGLDVANVHRVPLVLEFNASEVWARNYGRSVGPAPWLRRWLLDPLGRRMEDVMLRSADLVVAISELVADEAVALGTDRRRVRVVPNGADGAPFAATAPPRDPADGRVRIGWVGTFGKWHGAAVLVEALALLPDHVEAVLIGTGPDHAEVAARADALGIGRRTRFTGPLPRAQALATLAGCDILASPHVPFPDRPFFGSPTKLFEYLALGRPVVASDLEQIGEIVRDGDTGVLVEPDSPEALAAGIRRLLALPDRGAALGRRARQDALAHHTWTSRARAVVDALAPPQEAVLA